MRVINDISLYSALPLIVVENFEIRLFSSLDIVMIKLAMRVVQVRSVVRDYHSERPFRRE